MKRGVRAVAAAAIGLAGLSTSGVSVAAGRVTAAPAAGVVRIDVEFSWNGTRSCGSQRPGSVVCISGKATVASLGEVEYARDAVPTGATTSDGCLEYSTHGTLWVAGGTAVFDGAPAATCGGNDQPDAHYTYTIRGGTGVLAGATGSGDIVADKGVDRWHGTIQAAGLASRSQQASPSTRRSTTAPVLAVVAGAFVLAVGSTGVVFVRRRHARSVAQP